MNDENTIPRETKDWSLVSSSGCSECGYTPHRREETSARLRNTSQGWQEVLRRPNVSRRPNAQTWSPIEYAAHVRDMCKLAGERVGLMLSRITPMFSNWDQDEQAVINDYLNAEAKSIAADLNLHLELAAQAFEQIGSEHWNRQGQRSDGNIFTLGSFAEFVLHEVEHHLQDAQGGPKLPGANA